MEARRQPPPPASAYTIGDHHARLCFVDNDLPPYDGTETWVELLLRDPANRAAIAMEVRAVAEEIAADPRYGDDEPLGPDEEARARFREFARKLDS